ncbi:MAG: hypothetical protein CM15mP77_2540 [Synechococcus sp.]|nr:MAG: hypothetical protein CM15mP77_2540 [Synechococcus sp.]
MIRAIKPPSSRSGPFQLDPLVAQLICVDPVLELVLQQIPFPPAASASAGIVTVSAMAGSGVGSEPQALAQVRQRALEQAGLTFSTLVCASSMGPITPDRCPEFIGGFQS